MNIIRSERCIAKLRPGEVKRTPRTRLYPPAGYYVACPACGLVIAITADEQTFTEEIVDDVEVLTMAPGYKCDRPKCGKVFSYVKDEIRIADA